MSRTPRRAALTLLGLAAFMAANPLHAQTTASPPTDSASLTVIVRRDTTPIADATVRSRSTGLATDERGMATLRLPAGTHDIRVTRIGFREATFTVVLRAGTDTTVAIALVAQPTELSSVVVSATRSGRRIDDEPLRVEVLEQEEVEEKLLMTPGDITMMLNESSGLRVQTTSPALGGAVVRVQGLRGRYTQILADGLPLYGGQTGGLGLLQIPPMDLGGVEIIKGVASALYGGSALGGIINLISRRPEEERATELLLNQTTLGGTDVVGFASSQLSSGWGYTLLAGGHRQVQVDRDDDGWADLAGYERGVIRPRLFWTGEGGHSLMLTAGTTVEQREGGTMEGEVLSTSEERPEHLRTNRYDGGLVGGFLLGGSTILSIRAATAIQRHRHTFGGWGEKDQHVTSLGEAALNITRGRSLWVVGAAVQEERYQSDDIPAFDYRFTTPGAFLQNTLTLWPALSVTASARVDRHREYGTQVAPRLSALVRLGPVWTLRLSGGGGYFAPTPFTEETEIIGLRQLEPLDGLKQERAQSASIDVGGVMGPLELNATLFGSVVKDPVALRQGGTSVDRVALFNLSAPTRTAGAELLARWNPEPFHVTGSYTFVRSTEPDADTGVREDTPLTPRHQAGIVTMWEQEERARAGLEIYYTGVQRLVENPYRTRSRPYVHVGVLVERRFGPARLFVNAENLLGYRQTRWDPLVIPTQGQGGRRTTDVWAPLEGRVANVGVRFDRK